MDFEFIKKHKQHSFDLEQRQARACVIARYRGENVLKVIAPHVDPQYSFAILHCIYENIAHDEIYIILDVAYLHISKDEYEDKNPKELIDQADYSDFRSMMFGVIIADNKIAKVAMAPYHIDYDDQLVWDDEEFNVNQPTMSDFTKTIEKIINSSVMDIQNPSMQTAYKALNVSTERANYIRMQPILEFLAEKDCMVQDFYSPRHPEFKDILKLA